MTVVVTFKIDEEMLTLIDSLAYKLNTTRSALIRLALNDLLFKYSDMSVSYTHLTLPTN